MTHRTQGRVILEITVLLHQKDINAAVNRKDPRGYLSPTASVVHCPKFREQHLFCEHMDVRQ